MRISGATILALVLGLGLLPAAASSEEPAQGAPTAVGTATKTAGAQSAPATAQATPEAADEEAASGIRQHYQHHHSGGVTRFVVMSLDTLGVDEAKRPQLEKLRSDLRSQIAPAREAEKELLRAIADGVGAGSLDKAKIDAAVAKATTTDETAHGAGESALNQLHALLSPAERAALVDKVKANWEVWSKVNPNAPRSASRTSQRLAELSKEVNLTPDQVTKINTALNAARPPRTHTRTPSLRTAGKRVQAFCDAFVKGSFEAKTLRSGEGGAITSHGSRRMASFYEAATPLLTPEQRAQLADHLREYADQAPATTEK